MCAEESEKEREEDGGGSAASFIYLTAALIIQPQNFLHFFTSLLKLILLNPTRFLKISISIFFSAEKRILMRVLFLFSGIRD